MRTASLGLTLTYSEVTHEESSERGEQRGKLVIGSQTVYIGRVANRHRTKAEEAVIGKIMERSFDCEEWES